VNFYKRHLGDIAKSLSNLTQGQMGAYDLLLDWHYANEQPLPLDTDELYMIGRCRSKPERDNVDRVLRYFDKTADGYIQKRAVEEIQKADHQRSVNREVGKRGGRPKLTESVSEPITDSVANRNPSQTPDSRLQTPASQENQSATADLLGSTVVDLRRTIPECPHQSIVAMYHEVLPELRQVREWDGDRQKFLRTRWREAAERQSLDWWREFFAYIRQSHFLMGRTTGRDGRPFDCDLEWIVRPKNFRKIVEGKYENKGAAAA
jgi:uncharacterized protein YdaU (DUF1376 family)